MLKALLFMSAVAALAANTPQRNDFAELNYHSYVGTELKVALAMKKHSFSTDEPIRVYMKIKNTTNHVLSASHDNSQVTIIRADTLRDVTSVFRPYGEIFPSALPVSDGQLQPGADYDTVFVLTGHGSAPSPGQYIVTIRLTILRGLGDHTPIGDVELAPVDFVVVP